MSCCGCASRVLKLQSEIRSWKTLLADERREKRMILRWIMAVFGYDVKVDINRETHGVRVQATEDREAVSKALIRIGNGNEEGEFGMMVMELKLESHEFYESFEDSTEMTEFPILEINGMTTSHPLISTGLGGFSQPSQSLSVSHASIPLEVASTATTSGVGNEQEVLYFTGNFEEGGTLEGPNGQSYLILKSNSEDIPVPMELDYGARHHLSEGLSFIPSTLTCKQIQASLPIMASSSSSTTVEPKIEIVENSERSLAVEKSLPKKKASSFISNKEKSAIKKRMKTATTDLNELKKDKSSKPQLSEKLKLTSAKVKHPIQTVSKSENLTAKSKLPEVLNVPNKQISIEFGLTLREKAEIYVLQKAKESVEKVGSMYRCTACEENRYTYSSFDAAMAHSKTHYESKPYKCEYCDELFSIQRGLLSHRKTVHPKPKGSFTSVSSRLIQSKSTPITTMPKTTGSLTSVTPSSSATKSAPTRKSVTKYPAKVGSTNTVGPISISKEMLAALLGSNNSTAITASTAGGSNLKSVIPVVTKVPTIVVGTGGVGTAPININNLSLSFVNT